MSREDSRSRGGKRPRKVPVVVFAKFRKASTAAAARADARALDEEHTTDTELFLPSMADFAASPRRRKEAERASRPTRSNASRQQRLSRGQQREVASLGHQLFETGRLMEAQAVFEHLVGLGAEDAFPHTMLGTVYLARGDRERALALFEAALAIDRNDLAALVYRGEIRLAQGKLPAATKDLQRAVTQGAVEDPFVERAHRLLKVARSLGRRRR